MDILSAIGGTMGLLTGFSIISGVEICYHVIKSILNLRLHRLIRLKLWEGKDIIEDSGNILDNGPESLKGGRLGVFFESQQEITCERT